MKIFVAAVVVATAIGVPALAQAAGQKTHHKTHVRAHSEVARVPTSSAQYLPRAAGPYGDDGHRPCQCVGRHSSNPGYDVYRGNGDYAGSDPDPRIRAFLYWDNPDGAQ